MTNLTELEKEVLCVILVSVIVVVLLLVGLASILKQTDYQRRAAFVSECLAADAFTREECLVMAGDSR